MSKILGIIAILIAVVLVGFFVSGRNNGSNTEEKSQVKEAQTKQTPIFKDISAKEAADLVEKNKDNADFGIIDVRTPSEYALEHLDKATNIDYSSSNFKSELEKLDKNKTYFIYCHSGNRSKKALEVMRELEFSEVYNMLGGISAWTDGGFPTVK
jgi:rhodanese-related sulfurtransferase